MSLIWIDVKDSRTAAELTAARKHVQKKRQGVTRTTVQTPCLRPMKGLRAWPAKTAKQRANLAYFERRTLHEWSGWRDLPFWTLALSISHTCDAVAHALVAFAALHQGNQQVAYVEHARSLVQPQTHFDGLVSCMMMICFQNLTGQKSFRLLRSGLAMLEECPDDRIKPCFDALRARPCMMPDLSAALQVVVARRIPQIEAVEVHHFATVHEARDCLARILRHGLDLLGLAMSVEPVRSLLRGWEAMLDDFDSSSAVAATPLLRAAAVTGWVLLSSDFEDGHFNKIMDLIEEAGHAKVCFGVDGGLMDMLCFVGTKCQGPARHRALSALQDRVEGDRPSALPAAILALHIELEETCERVKLLEGRECHGRIELTFEGASGLHKREVKVPIVSTSGRAEAIFTPGCAAYLDGDSYWRLELQDFHFPMPRV